MQKFTVVCASDYDYKYCIHITASNIGEAKKDAIEEVKNMTGVDTNNIIGVIAGHAVVLEWNNG